MKPSHLAAALRNYAKPIWLRGNSFAILSAGYFAALMMIVAATIRHHETWVHGARWHLAHTGILLMWTMLAGAAPGSVFFHYARQVRVTIAPVEPGLIDAEADAALVLSMPVAILLALPLVAMGAPPIGSLAASLTAVAFVASTLNAQGAQQGAVRLLRSLFMLPLIVVGMFYPDALLSLIFAPAPIATALCVAALPLIWLGLRFDPVRYAHSVDAIAAASSRVPLDKARRRKPVGVMRALVRGLAWQPRFMTASPLPQTQRAAGGMLAQFLITMTTVGLALGAPMLFAWIAGASPTKAMHHSAPMAVALGTVIPLQSSGQWLVQRGEWPFLFIAGRYGSRAGFSRALFRGHFYNTVSKIMTTTLAALLWCAMLGLLPPASWLIAGWCFAGAMFGAAYAGILPLLWRRFSGRSVVAAAHQIGLFGTVYPITLIGLLRDGVQEWAVLGATVCVGFGVWMAWIGPRRLETMDWNFDPR